MTKLHRKRREQLQRMKSLSNTMKKSATPRTLKCLYRSYWKRHQCLSLQLLLDASTLCWRDSSLESCSSISQTTKPKKFWETKTTASNLLNSSGWKSRRFTNGYGRELPQRQRRTSKEEPQRGFSDYIWYWQIINYMAAKTFISFNKNLHFFMDNRTYYHI